MNRTREEERATGFSPIVFEPVKSLDNYRELLDKLTIAQGAIKVYCEVADLA